MKGGPAHLEAAKRCSTIRTRFGRRTLAPRPPFVTRLFVRYRTDPPGNLRKAAHVSRGQNKRKRCCGCRDCRAVRLILDWRPDMKAHVRSATGAAMDGAALAVAVIAAILLVLWLVMVP